jgi:class 3 adenylate cyclase
VNIGSRVAGEGSAGDVLVTTTVRDLVSGSRIGFADRGEHKLKGVADRWRLFTVTDVG